MHRIALVFQDLSMPSDVSAALTQTASEQPETFTHIDDLLAKSDAPYVWIHTRTGLHAEYAIKALQAGRDVVCNAPLCITSSAAWQILETAKYTGRKLMVINHCGRFWRQAARELGTLRRVHAWARTAENPGGNRFPDGGHLYGIFYPFAEALTTVLGPIDSISGNLDREADADSLENAGHAELALEHGGTAFLDWTVGANASDRDGFSIKLEGENGSLTVSGTFGQDTLQVSTVETDGIDMTDPGLSKCLADRLPAVLDGGKDGRLDAFRALRVVEFIDRLYNRIQASAE